ncbi:wall-associated receptor kinase 2-like [Typha angustifolia]|uniref:wall-associated receptor kinase 2-like n=1 Tax=Typha angustifolia TaxID=59011 RepID=UPI003C2E3A6D
MACQIVIKIAEESSFLPGVKMSILGALCFHFAVTAAAAAGGVSLLGCQATCGNINFSYPFGIGQGCFLEGFNLTCDEISQPPKLFLGDGTIEVIDILMSLNTVRIKSKMISTGVIGQDLNASWKGLPDKGPFVLSSRHNQFAVIGCGIYARFLSRSSGDTIGLCAAMCPPSKIKSDNNFLCSGIYCDRTSIPVDFRSCDVYLGSLNQTPRWAKSLPNSAGVVETEWLDRHTVRLVSLHINASNKDHPTNSEVIPALLNWWFPNSSCADAKNRPDYACRSRNSYCSNSQDNSSYVCTCSQGYQGNPYLVDGCQDIDECQDPRKYPCYGVCTNLPGNYDCTCPRGKYGDATIRCFKGSKPYLPGISYGLSSGLGFLLLVAGALLINRKLKKRRAKKLKEKFFKQNRGLFLQQVISSNRDTAERIKIFNLEELEKATNNFDNTRIVGRGGHGTVYKGILSDLRVVAVKKSKILVRREIDEFINEVVILSQINHRNVVKLFECCLETEVPLLVYEFISNGTLSDHLHAGDGRSLLWKDRLRIAAVETSGALAYLHSAASISVFHRDVKSPNILLDDAFTAKISDFGASRSVPLDQTSITTVVQGTFGYLDPEYYHTGQLTEKSDVYSFGIILVELLTRKRPASTLYLPEAGSLAANFLCFMRENRVLEILDEHILEEGRMVEEIKAVCCLAEMCIRLKGEERPNMKEVEVQLEALRGRKRQLLHPWIVQRLEESQSQRSLVPSHPSTEDTCNLGTTSQYCSVEVEQSSASDYTP